MNDMIQNLSSVDLRIPTAVAVSGGVDSMSLLYALASRAREVQQPLWAFHIHHDLQAAADGWQVLVREAAARLGVSFDTRRVVFGVFDAGGAQSGGGFSVAGHADVGWFDDVAGDQRAIVVA